MTGGSGAATAHGLGDRDAAGPVRYYDGPDAPSGDPPC